MECLARVDPAPTTKTTASVEIDAVLCKQCGLCVGLCPRDVFDPGAQGTPTPARLDDCTACRICELHCPDFAIRVVRPGQADPCGEEAG